MKFKRKHLAEALNMTDNGIKHFTTNKSQKVVVSEEQLNRLIYKLMEQQPDTSTDADASTEEPKDPNLPGGTNQTQNKEASLSRDRSVQELIDDKVNWNAMSPNEQNGVKGEGYTSTSWAQKINESRQVNVIKEQDIPIELPDGCEDCLKAAIGTKYASKMAQIILALGEFIELGETPTLIELAEIMSDVDPLDALIIGPKLIACDEVCGVEWESLYDMELANKEIEEDTEGQETYDYASSEGHDEYRLKHDDMSRSHRRNLRKDMSYDEEHEDRREGGTHFWESKKLRTTTPITESEVKEISNFMDRMNTTGQHYNPAPSSKKKLEDLYEDINKTYRLIKKAIINEGTSKLQVKDYQEVLLEQGMRDRNPGIAAAEGIENILDNIKRAYTYIKDSRTKKQIWNTLQKMNNFLSYSGELVGSGASQRSPRSYEQIAEPLPYPEVEEELDEFHELGMFNPGDGADDESYDGHHFEDDVIGAYDDDLTGKAREGEVYEQEDTTGEDKIQGFSTNLLTPAVQKHLKGKQVTTLKMLQIIAGCWVDSKKSGPLWAGLQAGGESWGDKGGPYPMIYPKDNLGTILIGATGGGADTFNPCKAIQVPSRWRRSDFLVPGIQKFWNKRATSVSNSPAWLEEPDGSEMDTNKLNKMQSIGNSLTWVADGNNGVDTMWTLTKK